MKFALSGVGSGSTARPEVLVQVAQKAEALGFESVWIPEHLVVPVEITARYPYSADGKFPGGPGAALHDPFVALGFIAACTKTIKLGTGVFVLPLRNSLAAAKAATSVDVLSQGRLLFGIGIGWLEDEFNAVGMSFKDRAARTREAIAMMKTLWTEETPQFSGKFHSFPPLGFSPKPVQKPHPPIIFGGESRPALKRVAELGDGWFGFRYTPESIKPQLALLKELTEKAGRDFSRLEITIAPQPGLELTLDIVKQFADAGVHRLMTFAPGFIPRSKFDTELYPKMEKFSEEVIAKA
ncbi:MAG TPA: LLM class F420-dependent oxidoreductase [Methylomirabilota bacterium]|jgi:probable F420-dependent oxidoreductase|nr:LLM class F420-dependent oxidoreductase [Methylomirabilota bacterium]